MRPIGLKRPPTPSATPVPPTPAQVLFAVNILVYHAAELQTPLTQTRGIWVDKAMMDYFLATYQKPLVSAASTQQWIHRMGDAAMETWRKKLGLDKQYAAAKAQMQE